MARLAAALAVSAAMLISTAQAQIIQRPVEVPLGVNRPAPGIQGPAGQGPGAPILKPDLGGTLKTPTPAPQVQQPTQVTPPPPARAGTPDGGDSSPCECYRMEFVDTMSRDGRVTRQHVLRSTGTKSLACCRR